jgi:Glycine-zipper domain
MRSLFLTSVALAFIIAAAGALATTKSDHCSHYATNAMHSTPTSTGLARGAARGAVGGAIFGNAGRGAAIGAAVGGTRRVVQKNRSYQYYYDHCMSG